MSWAGAWAPAAAGVAGAQSVAGVTAEQWAALQWQQWAHWQEQYRQWQLTYGEKFAEQTLARAAPAQPPLPPPAAADQRPPPPPEAPPPQPDPAAWYAHAWQTYAYQAPPVPVPAPVPPVAAPAPPPVPVPAVAAPVPAQTDDDDRFDEQFRKWEEEFEAWKRQNADHPDRAAYLEYEKKFQACRRQLLQKKEQAKARRAAVTAPEPKRLALEPPPPPPAPAPAPVPALVRVEFPSADAGRGIPGLDLVPEAPVEILDPGETPRRTAPDLEAISKGIDGILGDKKLLDMLSAVTKAGVPAPERPPAPVRRFGFVPGPAAAPPPETPFDDHVDGLGNAYADLVSAARDRSLTVHGASLARPSPTDVSAVDESPGDRSPTPDGPLLEPYVTVDYDHEPVEPFIEFFEPVQTFDYDHVSSRGGMPDAEPRGGRRGGADRSELRGGCRSGADRPELWGARRGDVEFWGSRRSGRNADDHGDFEFWGGRRDGGHPDVHADVGNRESAAPRRPHPGRPDRGVRRERDSDRRDERFRIRHEDRDRHRDRNHERRDRADGRYGLPEHAVTDVDDRQTLEVPDSGCDTKTVVMIDDVLESPGREVRPEKIVIVLRGLPGSGKSYLAKLIKDREVENGGSARILSMDDYFMVENEEDKPNVGDGKREMKYEYDASMESVYSASLIKSLKRTISDGYFPFIVVDGVNDRLQHFDEIDLVAKQFGFKVYVCEMEVDVQTCHKRNVHDRTVEDIQNLANNWCSTPSKFTLLDATTLLQSAAIDHVQMEDVSDVETEEQSQNANDRAEDEVLAPFSSKWDKLDDTDKLARLDGTSKPLRHNISTMEDFLQLDEWDFNKTAKPGKKMVRWADVEERREQEKMRAIGFVVGQTDWGRMTDPTQGSSALTQTKYIERIPRY